MSDSVYFPSTYQHVQEGSKKLPASELEQMVSGTHKDLKPSSKGPLQALKKQLDEATEKSKTTKASEKMKQEIGEIYDRIFTELTTSLHLPKEAKTSLKKYIEQQFSERTSVASSVDSLQKQSPTKAPFFDQKKSSSTEKMSSTQSQLISFPPIMPADKSKAVVDFLTNPSANGVAYTATAGELAGKVLPLSYQTSSPEKMESYWAKYVTDWAIKNDPRAKGKTADQILAVADNKDPNTGAIGPSVPDSLGAEGQLERMNATYGADIYDVACAQIAGALGSSDETSAPDKQKLIDFTQNIDLWHKVGYNGDESDFALNQNRVTEGEDNVFHYQGVGEPSGPPKDGDNGYLFRLTPKTFQQTDPLSETETGKRTISGTDPGQFTWEDWKPITGENVWGFLIGPLQSEQVKAKAKEQAYCDFSSNAVQNSMNLLPALRAMQSSEGPLFYAVSGSLGNVGSESVDPRIVSVENNASTLAGLQVMRKVLNDELKNNPTLTAAQKSQIVGALDSISIMVDGGGEDADHHTKGLLSFFKNDALHGTLEGGDLGIYQGGLAKTKTNVPPLDVGWQPPSPTEPKAVDCQTWAVSALGQPFIDENKGYGASFQIFENMLTWGGYYDASGNLKGVGYSDKDGNGNGEKPGKVISAEWTAGAINTCRSLIQQYTDSKTTNPGQEAVKQGMIVMLQTQEASMVKGLMSLRVDNYSKDPSYDNVRPPNYDQMGLDPNSFVYASTRYNIPFGWMANPLPSTTSTAWAKMINDNFNPFSPDGSYGAASIPPSSTTHPKEHNQSSSKHHRGK